MKGIKGKVIAITSSKGGVGKTIFATNLAGVYEYLKMKVLLIDMDLSCGGINVMLNVTADKTIYNLADDILNNRFKNTGDYIYHYSDYIDILSSCKDPRQGNKIDVKIIEQIINAYKNNYDVLILDTNHVPTTYTLESLDLADNILFMITDNPLDLKNSASFIKILNDIKKEGIYVVLNNSLNSQREYFSKFDIKSIIHHNIDYILPSSMHINNINKYLMDGKILLLNNNLKFNNKSDQEILIRMAYDMVGEKNEK